MDIKFWSFLGELTVDPDGVKPDQERYLWDPGSRLC